MRHTGLIACILLLGMSGQGWAAPPRPAIAAAIESAQAPELVRRGFRSGGRSLSFRGGFRGGRSYGYRASRPHWSRNYSFRPRGGRWF